jgi:hypothetical protein
MDPSIHTILSQEFDYKNWLCTADLSRSADKSYAIPHSKIPLRSEI